jgi:putative phosphoesterase
MRQGRDRRPGTPYKLQSLPESKIFNIGKFKIGLIHGHTIVPWGDEDELEALMREMNVDLLICGHTHEQKIKKVENRYLLNPGSITGVEGPNRTYFFNGRAVNPSFALLEFKE